MKLLAIAIPVHGYSAELHKKIDLIRQCHTQGEFESDRVLIFIGNSSVKSQECSGRVSETNVNFSLYEIELPSTAYWTENAYACLLNIEEYFEKNSHLFEALTICLLNHDCVFSKQSLCSTTAAFSTGSHEVWHPVVLYPDGERVWWGGTRYRWDLKQERPWHGCTPDALPTGKWETDSMPAQCLIFDGQLLKDLEFESIARRVPHYKGDPCLSVALRKAGGKLYAVREPTVKVNLEDQWKKDRFLRPKTWTQVKRCLTHPLSYRNLGGTYWGCRYERRWALTGHLAGAYYATGKLLKTLGEYIFQKR